MTWLPEGCASPDPKRLEEYWLAAGIALAPDRLPDHYQVRWIGLDHATTEEVIELIIAGDKTGTFSLPWLIEKTAQPVPAVGDCIILIDFGGRPRLLVRLTAIDCIEFGSVTAADTAIDGTPVRDLSIWIPLHTRYWNGLLEPFGLQVTANMPVLTEKFDLLHINELHD